MKVIFEEYSGIIITAVAIVALIAIIGLMLGTDGPVHDAFTELIKQLFSKTGLTVTGS
ncbi:hypothetical protein C806_03854 [Lachnospiraceae bacterium 3-1]|nr:hypothetical protein C806_03854 [Lachnospiraceae bacterium 3-1]